MWSLNRNSKTSNTKTFNAKTSRLQERAPAPAGTMFELTQDEAAAVSGGYANIAVTYVPQTADGSLPKSPAK